jgi:hypothetical protein
MGRVGALMEDEVGIFDGVSGAVDKANTFMVDVYELGESIFPEGYSLFRAEPVKALEHNNEAIFGDILEGFLGNFERMGEGGIGDNDIGFRGKEWGYYRL